MIMISFSFVENTVYSSTTWLAHETIDIVLAILQSVHVKQSETLTNFCNDQTMKWNAKKRYNVDEQWVGMFVSVVCTPSIVTYGMR